MNYANKHSNHEASWQHISFILAVTALILFARKPDALLNPQFWAEDGVIFFLEQYKQGVSAIFKPYAGYYHLVPRLVALYTDRFFPYTLAPSIYNYSCFLISIGVVASVFSPRFKVPYKVLFALAIVLIPHHTGEVFTTITNIQWMLFIALIVILMKDTPCKKYGNIHIQATSDYFIIIICGLTGPFSIFLLPLFAYRYLTDRNVYRLMILFMVSFVALIQSFAVIQFLLSLDSYSDNTHFNFIPYVYIVGQKIFGGLFLGHILAPTLDSYFLASIYLIVIFFLFLFSLKRNKFVSYFLTIHLIVLFSTFYKFKLNPEILIPFENGPRYFYIPYLMLAWSLILLLAENKMWKKLTASIALIFILFSSLTSDFKTKEYTDYKWYEHSQSIGKKEITIPINPSGWHMEIPAKN